MKKKCEKNSKKPAKKPPQKLTDKQKQFVHEYLKDSNACQAAIRAGYAKKCADSQGIQLLRNPKVFEYLQQLRDQDAINAGISRDWVLHRYKILATADIRETAREDGTTRDLRELPDDIAYATKKFKNRARITGEGQDAFAEIEYEIADKKSALDSICKVLGYNKEDETGAKMVDFAERLIAAKNRELAEIKGISEQGSP